MNYPSDFPSCIKLNYSVSSHHFFFFFLLWNESFPPADPQASCLSVRSSLTACHQSDYLSVSRPGWLTAKWWDETGKVFTLEGIDFVVVFIPCAGIVGHVPLRQRKRTVSTNGGKMPLMAVPPHCCHKAQKHSKQVENSINCPMYAHATHASKRMPLVHEYPIA